MASKAPEYQASLVVESRGEAPSVRSAASTVAWSRLYKADDYHIDLAFQAHTDATELRGQLLPPSATVPRGNVSLYNLSDQQSTSVPLSSSGTFLFPVTKAGPYSLTLKLEGATLAIDSLDIGV